MFSLHVCMCTLCQRATSDFLEWSHRCCWITIWALEANPRPFAVAASSLNCLAIFPVLLWKTEPKHLLRIWELPPSTMGSGNWTQVIFLGSKYSYPVSHVVGLWILSFSCKSLLWFAIMASSYNALILKCGVLKTLPGIGSFVLVLFLWYLILLFTLSYAASAETKVTVFSFFFPLKNFFLSYILVTVPLPLLLLSSPYSCRIQLLRTYQKTVS